MLGSPYTDSYSFRFMPRPLKGSDMSPMHKNTYCYGKDLRGVQPPKGFSLAYVMEFYQCYKSHSKEFFTRPHWFDLLMGTNQVRLDMLNGKDETTIRKAWQKNLEKYKAIRKKYLIYLD